MKLIPVAEFMYRTKNRKEGPDSININRRARANSFTMKANTTYLITIQEIIFGSNKPINEE